MTLEPKSLNAAVIFLALTIISFGLISFGLDIGNWLVPTASIFGGGVLFIEILVKKHSNLSTLKKFGAQQYVTLVVGGLSILNGVLTLPPLNITIDFLAKISGFVLILVGLFVLVEWFTRT